LSGVYFALGFAGTNLSFSGASAAFVETVKAAEPITSAATAVAWGIEVLSIQEGSSLLTIVAGVLISTLGNANHGGGGEGSSLSQSLRSSASVMMANLCFSFRGLHQKLFRATPHGGKNSVDDLNLQFRMQQVGMIVLAVPVLIWDTSTLMSILFQHREITPTLEFLGLALINGFAFTSYK
jgi:drug/metabolite transporter (DMT)-like permease